MKETKKQIKAQVINEVRRQYDQKLQQKTEAIAAWQKRYMESDAVRRDVSKECRQLRDENLELKQKVQQYEDWIERMQEFCGLPDGERQKAFTTYMDGIKAKAERDEALKHTAEFFGRFTSVLFM